MDLNWVMANDNFKEEVNTLADSLNVPLLISQILLRRGIDNLDTEQKSFLNLQLIFSMILF